MEHPWKLCNSCFRNDQSSGSLEATDTLNVHAPVRTIGLFYLSINALSTITHMASMTYYQCNEGDGTITTVTREIRTGPSSWQLNHLIVLIQANLIAVWLSAWDANCISFKLVTEIGPFHLTVLCWLKIRNTDMSQFVWIYGPFLHISKSLRNNISH